MELKQLKKGDFFTIKEIENPLENQVYIKDYYDNASKKYVCHKFSDINDTRIFKADKKIYTDFIF